MKHKAGPEDSAILMSLLQRFFFDFYPDKADAEAVWHRLMTHNPLRVKGSKIDINRFMAAIKKGIDEAPNWTMSYIIYLITCIESGYLNDAKFKGILKKKADAAEAHNGTSSSKMNPWESALVKACGNQMVVACMMFSDVHTQYLQRAINAVMKPSLVWPKAFTLAAK